MTAAVRDSAAETAKVIETPAAGGSAWEPRRCEEGTPPGGTVRVSCHKFSRA
jgi:hypothetical protein